MQEKVTSISSRRLKSINVLPPHRKTGDGVVLKLINARRYEKGHHSIQLGPVFDNPQSAKKVKLMPGNHLPERGISLLESGNHYLTGDLSMPLTLNIIVHSAATIEECGELFFE